MKQTFDDIRKDESVRKHVLGQQHKPHAGLWLDKFLKEQDSDQDKKKAGNRSRLVGEVAAIPAPAFYENFFRNRWKVALKGYGARFAEATVKGRMIVGLGNESVIETGIALHRTYGVPYIPGSSLKGLAAAYARQQLDEARWGKKSQAYKVLFGDTEDAGYITFFDALYMPNSGHLAHASAEGAQKKDQKKQALYPDVITVHHQEYYQAKGEKAPADWDSPIPVPFLSATGTYLVALAASDLESQNREMWITRTFALLKLALADMGIGAKTSSGYGRMELVVKHEEGKG